MSAIDLETARTYTQQCQRESDRIDAMSPGRERDQRLAALLRYLDTRWLMIPADIRRKAMNDSSSEVA